MMDDLIYRPGVTQAIETAQRSLLTDNDALWENNRKYHKGLAWSRRIIDDAPTVDAVEVVRCKECKHRGDYSCPMYHEEYSEWVDDGYHESEIIEHDRTKDEGFCDLGERREDDGV